MSLNTGTGLSSVAWAVNIHVVWTWRVKLFMSGFKKFIWMFLFWILFSRFHPNVTALSSVGVANTSDRQPLGLWVQYWLKVRAQIMKTSISTFKTRVVVVVCIYVPPTRPLTTSISFHVGSPGRGLRRIPHPSVLLRQPTSCL